MPDMKISKEEEAKGEQLPAYEEFAGPSSTTVTQPEVYTAQTSGPTVASPFNFPSDTHLPAYSETADFKMQERPIAIPQVAADPKAPFLDAYPDVLLKRGVTAETWSGFLKTLSGFLAATVSDKAVSHAGQMARHVGEVPKRFGKETLAHAKATGHAIADSARKGNYIGAAAHTLVGGAFVLPLATTFRAIGASMSLPFAAISAAAEDPKTPRERALAYAAAANAKWLHRRGLEALLLDTAELGPLLGISVDELLMNARAPKGPGAAAQMLALGAHLAPLEVRTPAPLDLGATTLWLVVTQKPYDGESDRENVRGKGKGKEQEGGKQDF
ncbi:hypothetical protein F4804DRAFT_309720 [Jackrogersella minutella]|nr:hypothetical protein F4804DRAFT_309720 [Jackrogersella minutella]